VAACTADASFGRSARNFAASSPGMSMIVAKPFFFGIRSACPALMGKASRKASECSVSKIL